MHGRPKDREMKHVSILEDQDIIRAGDHVRQLDILFSHSQADTFMHESSYGSRINRMKWLDVQEYMPYWVGKTLGQFHAGSQHMVEVIRGEIPVEHREKPKK